jgi:transposase-like protein
MEDEGMPQKKHKPEEIVAKLRQVDVLVSQGQSVSEAVRSIGVTQFTYYRWRKEFGGLKTDHVKRLKELEKENERLRKAVSDLTLEKLILREAASGNFRAPPAVVVASTTSGGSSRCRNGSPAVCWASIVRPSGRRRAVAPTKMS